MKKWIFIVVVACIAFTAANYWAKTKANADPQPKPLITFDGGNVIYSDELDSAECH